MKKILAGLMAGVLCVQCATLPVSCNNGPATEQFKPNNVYFLGDSLTDDGALVGITNDIFHNNPWSADASLTLDPTDVNSKINLSSKPSFSFDSNFFDNNKFSNGGLAAEQLTNYFGLKLKPAWDYTVNFHQPTSRPFDVYMNNFNIDNLHISQKGNDYAVGFSKAIDDNKSTSGMVNPLEELLGNFSLAHQTDALLKQHDKTELNKNSLVMICIGGDDLLQFLGDNAIYDFDQERDLFDKMMVNIQSAITKINSKTGATHFLLSNMPNFRLLPKYNQKNGVIAHRVEMLTDDFNSRIKQLIDQINASAVTNCKVTLFDLYTGLDDLLSSFGANKENDIINPILNELWDSKNVLNDIPSYFVKNLNVSNGYMLTSHWNISRENMDHFAFLDSIHPASWLQHEIGQKIIETLS